MEQLSQLERRTVGRVEPPLLVVLEELRFRRVDRGVRQCPHAMPMARGDALAHGLQGELSTQCITESLAGWQQAVMPVHPVVELQAVQVKSRRPGDAILDGDVVRPEL